MLWWVAAGGAWGGSGWRAGGIGTTCSLTPRRAGAAEVSKCEKGQGFGVVDVEDHPLIEGGAMVRVYHPEEGKAPDNWRGRKGTTTRAAYLREKYALTPRNLRQGTKRVGWKTRIDRKSVV